MGEGQRISIIHPDELSLEEKLAVEQEFRDKTKQGNEVFYPLRDVWGTDDDALLASCERIRGKIAYSDKIGMVWRQTPETLFYFGMAFMAMKPTYLIRPVQPTVGKSFDNVLISLDRTADLYPKMPGMEEMIPKKRKNNVAFICPVRNAPEEVKKFLEEYAAALALQGKRVHYPANHTAQVDPTGFGICSINRNGIIISEELFAYLEPTSNGSMFDYGMMVMAGVPLKIINKHLLEKEMQSPPNDIVRTIFALDRKYNP